MTPAYFVGQGNPVYASIFQILLETLTIPLYFYAIDKLFGRKNAIVSTIIYAISYGMISQSRWLSNVTPVIAFSNILLFLYVRQLQQKFKLIYVFLTSLVIGVISQHNAAIGIFLFPFAFWFYRKKLNIVSIMTLTAGFLLPAVPLIIFQFRHNFIIFQAIANFAASKGVGVGFSLGVFWNNLKILSNQINLGLIAPVKFLGPVFFTIGLIRLWGNKNKFFLYLYFLIPFFFLSLFQRGAIGFFFDAVLTLSISVCVYGIFYFPKFISYILLFSIVLINILNLNLVYKPTNALVPIGDANVITIQDRKNVIDWVYQKASGKEFSIWYYIIPFYHEEPWNYLFLTYALPKYRYSPEATHGFSPGDLKTSVYFFDIYEPEYDLSRMSKQKTWLDSVEKNFGQVIDSYRSHDVIVEMRKVK